jgi:dTDP-glucose 4,6-dehydratase
MTKLLVTGGAGFLGSHFVRSVLADRLPGLEGARITVLDKLTYAGNFANLGAVVHDKRLDFVPGDVADGPLVGNVLRGVDAVVHFAAETGAARSVHDAAAFTTSNVLGTQILLDAALRHGTARLILVSTDAVYGSLDDIRDPHPGTPSPRQPDAGNGPPNPGTPGNGQLSRGTPGNGQRDREAPGGGQETHPTPDASTWTETAPLGPTSPYAATKAAADLLALACHRTHGLGVSVVRVCSVYGPHQHPEKTIPRFATSLLDARPLQLPGDGGAVRDWLHVDDCCRAVARVLTGGRPGEIYHVAGSLELPESDLARLVLTDLHEPWSKVEPVPDAPARDRRRALDDTKIRRELGWHPRVEFTTGLAGTLHWYRANPGWWRPLLTV